MAIKEPLQAGLFAVSGCSAYSTGTLPAPLSLGQQCILTLYQEAWAFNYHKKLFSACSWAPGDPFGPPWEELRPVRAKAVVWGRRQPPWHPQALELAALPWPCRAERPSRVFPELHWHRVGQRSKNMCLCFCSVNGVGMTHQKHAGQMFVVMRCHFYTVTFLTTATF